MQRTPYNKDVVSNGQWPELAYRDWQPTCETLHLWTQIVGKIRLAQTPWQIHSWHATLYVTAGGLTTSPIPYETSAFQIDFDFVFSGRPAPRHPGGIPNLPDDITREAYSHEVSSAGFWPGGGPTDYAAFYSYAYPAPAGFDAACVRPAEAFYAASAGEFLLPYEAMRTSSDPDVALHEFLQSTYDAAADAGRWDRDALECARGVPRVPRAATH